MRTSIDIPDQLFKKMKTRAIDEEVTMKEFLLQILHKELEDGKNSFNRCQCIGCIV